MEINIEKRGGFQVVAVMEKRLEASNAAVFKSKLAQIATEGPVRIILDLSRVDFIDSSGLSSILSLLKSLGEEGELAICGPNQNVTTLFRLTRLDRIMKIFPNLEAATADQPG